MNKDRLEKHIDTEMQHYFDSARSQKCPASMKKNLYDQIGFNNSFTWRPSRLIVASLSLVFVTSVVFKFNQHQQNRHSELLQAQADLQVAMHYMNRVSFKSLATVNTKGLKPGLIKPLAKSAATF